MWKWGEKVFFLKIDDEVGYNRIVACKLQKGSYQFGVRGLCGSGAILRRTKAMLREIRWGIGRSATLLASRFTWA
jgi:hypothetical protein